MNNCLEVFCRKTKPSRNKFRSFVNEDPPRPPPINRYRESEDESASNPRSKVEDDLEFGGDLLKISQRRNFEEVDDEIDVRDGNGTHGIITESELVSGVDPQLPVSRSEVRNSSWGRRSSSWEISAEVLAANSTATESRIQVRNEAR